MTSYFSMRRGRTASVASYLERQGLTTPFATTPSRRSPISAAIREYQAIVLAPRRVSTPLEDLVDGDQGLRTILIVPPGRTRSALEQTIRSPSSSTSS